MNNIKDVAVNRKVYHDYFIHDTFIAGLVLLGPEIKSIRKGKVQLKEAFVSFIKNEAYIKGMNISEYKEANIFNHDETRDRKLLLNRLEIIKLQNKVKLDGFTIVPIKLFLKNGLAKLEIGLATGKKLHDKRYDDKVKTMKKEALKAMTR